MFTDLSTQAQEDFKDYYRQNSLIVTTKVVYKEGNVEITQHGQRLGMKEFMNFFKVEIDGKKVSELKEEYKEIRKIITDLDNQATKDSMINSLREYEKKNPKKCVLIPSRDQFYGFSRGKNLLEKYVQWIFVPAVKDITLEQTEGKDTYLGKILERTVRAKIDFSEKIDNLREIMKKEYEKIIKENQNILTGISESLASRLSEWSHPDSSLKIEWDSDTGKALKISEPMAKIIAGEGNFEGELSRFGNGFQRSYFLALLQELIDSNPLKGPTMILACEEPELYQHPPQSKHMFNILKDLGNENSHIIVCTHSPYFVTCEDFEDVRIIRKESWQSKSFSTDYETIESRIAEVTGKTTIKPTGSLAKIYQVLQTPLNEMFFSKYLILVEGLEDLAYLTTYLNLRGSWDKFRRAGCNIIPASGKHNLIRALAIVQCLKIPVYTIYDADSNETRKENREQHGGDNTALLKLCDFYKDENIFPKNDLIEAKITIWKENIANSIKEDIGQKWDSYCNQADNEFGLTGNLRKNMLHIGKTLQLVWEDGERSDKLDSLCERVLEFCVC